MLGNRAVDGARCDFFFAMMIRGRMDMLISVSESIDYFHRVRDSRPHAGTTSNLLP